MGRSYAVVRRKDDELIRIYEPGKSKKGRHKPTYTQNIANILSKDISISAKEIELVVACIGSDG